jgi:ATP-dependent RNA helicase DeaD
MSQKEFTELDIKPNLTRAIEKMGFTHMTPIQEGTFDPLMEGKDIMALAPTGTGKTAAFGLPILQMTDPKEKNVSTIVLCPTRELAKQTTDVLHQLTTFMHGVKVIAIYGGESIRTQIQKLKGKPQIIVATPGRIMDHMKRRTIRVNNVKRVILDEADRMLDMGFRGDIEHIMKIISGKPQMLMFSATMSKEVIMISERYLKDEVNVTIEGESRVVDTIKQYTAEVQSSKRFNALTKLLNMKDYGFTLVFVEMKTDAKRLARDLIQKGYNAIALHGDLTQKERDQVMKKCRSGNIRVLVATDVASRGLDLDNIDAVVNYDMPEDSDTYVHRIGRTGRANQKGDAYTLLDPSERRKMKSIVDSTNTKVAPIMLQEQEDADAYEKAMKQRALSFSKSSKSRRSFGRRR